MNARRPPRRAVVDHLLLGVSGSVGATFLPGYLTAFGMFYAPQITAIMTRAAESFISARTIALFCDRVLTEHDMDEAAAHLRAAEEADTFVVLPATANILAQAATGAGSSRLTTAILARQGAVVFFPNMGETIWRKPAVGRNVETLRADGHIVVDPVMQPAYVASAREVRLMPCSPPPERAVEILVNLRDPATIQAGLAGHG